jgi:acyl-CoA thioester hydrolase
MDAKAFRYLLRVRYGECDAQKVVFNARYGDYVDLASAEFLRALWGDAVFGGGLDYQLVRQVLEWRGSARFDEVLAISVCAERVGNTSFTLAMEMRGHADGRMVATAETVYVLMDDVTLAKKRVPDEERRRLERGAPGVIVDHAGLGLGTGPGPGHGAR